MCNRYFSRVSPRVTKFARIVSVGLLGERCICGLRDRLRFDFAQAVYFQITQGEFQTAVFGMIVVSDRKCDTDGIARQERRLLDAFSHAPAQGVENSPQFPVLSSQLLSFKLRGSCGFFAAADGCSIRIAVGRY